jgi:SPP1 family predicted phage head-tail adaptor
MMVGEMTERILIERAATSDDGHGGQDVTWSAVYPQGIWAKVRSVRGREQELHGRVASVETFVITVRFGVDVDELDRIVWRGKTMNVRSAADREGTREWWTLECEAGVNVNV